MKVRNGFVSNSSSSSFLLITPNPVTEEFVLGSLIKVPRDSLLFPLAKRVAKELTNGCEKVRKNNYLNFVSFIRDTEDVKKHCEKWIKKHKSYHIYVGCFYTEGCDVEEYMLSMLDVDMDTSDFFMYKEGGHI